MCTGTSPTTPYRVTRGSAVDSTSLAVRDTVTPGSDRDVFVIHGRDRAARDRFFEFLRAVDLRPLDWELTVMATGLSTPSLLRVIRTAMLRAQAIVALLTPDDMVALHPTLRGAQEPETDTAPQMQPRPNVLIELGMALMGFPERTIIIEIGRLRPVTDLGGLNTVQLDGDPTSVGKLVQRLRTAGCRVDDAGADWLGMQQRLADLAAYGRRPERTGLRTRTTIRRLVRGI